MADKKVSDLPSLNGADVDAADLLYIVDSSAGAAGSKKITVGQYQLAPVSGGTANTVVYLNGSKVESSSSALTFDGTNLGIGTSSPGAKLDVASTSAGATAEVLRLSNPGAGANTQAQLKFFTTSTNYGTISGGYGASAPQMTFDLPNVTAGNYVWQISSSEKMRLDSSGNLGLGATPSAWSNGFKALEIAGAASVAANGPRRIQISTNVAGGVAGDGSGGTYAVSFQAARYQQIDGVHMWLTAPSGTAGNAISFTQAMTLTNDTKLLIGVTGNIFPGTNRANVEVNGASQALLGLGVGGTAAGYVLHDGTDMEIVQSRNGYMRFLTNNTERARITSGGDLLVGTTDDAINSGTGVKLKAGANNNVNAVGSDSTNTTSNYNLYSTGAAAYRFYVGMGGTIYATSTTITAISDQRLKENIRDLDAGLSEIMALKPRKFDWKAGKGKDKKGDRGWIAQEFEQVFPDMVDTWQDPAPEGEEPYKAVNADLIPVLVKAIQEQQAIITALTARVAALEAK